MRHLLLCFSVQLQRHLVGAEGDLVRTAAMAHLGLFRDIMLNVHYNAHEGAVDGSSWPPLSKALSMAGQRKLDNFAALVATAVDDRVPGHIIETGVWRGGASFLAAKTLELLGDSAAGRRVYLADSFAGIPDQSTYLAPGAGGTSEAAKAIQQYMAGHKATGTLEKQDVTAHKLGILNKNSASRVREDARRIGLDPARLRFVIGFFNESLPALLEAEPELTFAVVRLDGDTFASTYEAISVLYPRLEPGGFLIVDDYTDWPSCRAAIEKYRTVHLISEPVTLVPHRAGEQVRGIYWRKQPSKAHALCPGMAEGEFRLPGAISGRVKLRLGARATDLRRGGEIAGVRLAECVEMHQRRNHERVTRVADVEVSGKNTGVTSALLNLWTDYSEPEGLDRWDVYATAYEAHLPRPQAALRIDMLEIGVQSGGSVRAWRQYYGRGLKYVGIDIDPKSKRSEIKSEHTHIAIGSQILGHVCREHGPFDVIIDDGAHTAQSIWTSLRVLWRDPACMKTSSSVYVIEDACTMMSPSFVSAAGEIAGIASEAWWAMHHHWVSQPKLTSVLGSVSGYPPQVDTMAAHNISGSVHARKHQHPLFQTHLAQVHLYDSIAFLVRRAQTPVPARIVRGTNWTRNRPRSDRSAA